MVQQAAGTPHGARERDLPLLPRPGGNEPSDEDLIAGMAARDEGAAVAFIRRQERRVFAVAFSLTRDRTAAEDVAQETFLQVWRHAGIFDRRKGTASAWTLTIARNLAVDLCRRRRTIPLDPKEIHEFPGTATTDGVEEATLEGELRSRLADALSQIPAEQRRSLVLSHFYGLSAEEIAASEAIPVGTAKSRIRLGLVKARNRLAEFG